MLFDQAAYDVFTAQASTQRGLVPGTALLPVSTVA